MYGRTTRTIRDLREYNRKPRKHNRKPRKYNRKPRKQTIIHKTYGAFTLPEMQLQVLTVNNTHVVFITSGMEGESKQIYEKPFNETDFEELVNLFERNGFFEMQDRYTPQEGQPIVTDVGTVEISLIEKNRSKTVIVDPYYSEYMPEGLQEIDSALLEPCLCRIHFCLRKPKK